MRKMSVLRKKSGQVADEAVLCYFRPFSEDVLTTHTCIEDWIAVLVQFQCISVNAGQSAGCVGTEGS